MRIYAIDPSTRSRMSEQLLLTMYAGAAAFTAMISMWWACWGMEGYMRRCIIRGQASNIGRSFNLVVQNRAFNKLCPNLDRHLAA